MCSSGLDGLEGLHCLKRIHTVITYICFKSCAKALMIIYLSKKRIPPLQEHVIKMWSFAIYLGVTSNASFAPSWAINTHTHTHTRARSKTNSKKIKNCQGTIIFKKICFFRGNKTVYWWEKKHFWFKFQNMQKKM